MAKTYKLSDGKKKEIQSFLTALFTILQMNDRDVLNRLDEYWGRYTGQWSAKKDKTFPWRGAADVQTGIVQYSVAGIEARYSSALNSIQFCNISSQVSEASNTAAKKAQDWLNNSWRHKVGVNDVLLEAFQYNTVEGTFFIQIVPEAASKKKKKAFSFTKIISDIKNVVLKPVLGQDGTMQTKDTEIDDFVGARWVNIPRRLIKFDNSANKINKSDYVVVQFEKTPMEIYNLNKRKENPWYNTEKILKQIKPDELPKPVINTSEQEMSEQTKNDYIGYIQTLTGKRTFYQWWISYNVGTPTAPDYKKMSFVVSKDTNELVYDEENTFFDQRTPIVSGKCRRIAGKIDGQGIPMYIGSLNDAIDILIDQALDNNTLANTITGTCIEQPGFTADKVTLQPGKWYPVKSHDALKQWVFQNRLPDIVGIEQMIQGFLERKSLVSDYSLGRESSINKKPTMRGTAMLLQEYGLNLDPLMQNTQEPLKEAVKQTLQCAYEFMPVKGITYSYQDKDTQQYKQGVLSRADLEYIDDFDIQVLQGAVDVMTNKESQNAMTLFQTLGQDQTGESNTFNIKENLADKLAPRDKAKIMRTPQEIQQLQMLKQKSQELAQKEQMINQQAQQMDAMLQQHQQGMAADKAKLEESKFLHDLEKKGIVKGSPQEMQMLAEFRQQYITREKARQVGINPDEQAQPPTPQVPQQG